MRVIIKSTETAVIVSVCAMMLCLMSLLFATPFLVFINSMYEIAAEEQMANADMDCEPYDAAPKWIEELNK